VGTLREAADLRDFCGAKDSQFKQFPTARGTRTTLLTCHAGHVQAPRGASLNAAPASLTDPPGSVAVPVPTAFAPS
jgi:hypothetical protein